MLRVAEGEVVALDGEDVREVGAELDLDGEADRAHALVPERDALGQPGRADEPLTRDGDRVRLEVLGRRIARVVGRGEVLDRLRGEEEWRRSVDEEPQPRQHARVVREETVGAVGDVAHGIAHAERVAFEDRQHPSSSYRIGVGCVRRRL